MKKIIIAAGIVFLYLGIALVSYHEDVRTSFYCADASFVKPCIASETTYPYVILGEAVSLMGIVTVAIGTVVWKEETFEPSSNEPSERCPWCDKYWKKSYITVHEAVCPYNPNRVKDQQDFFR